jgi:hypothetical protein
LPATSLGVVRAGGPEAELFYVYDICEDRISRMEFFRNRETASVAAAIDA